MKLLEAALIRALRTAAQVALAAIGSTAVLTGVNWGVVGSTVALAAVVSVLTSLAGLPEVGAAPAAQPAPAAVTDTAPRIFGQGGASDVAVLVSALIVVVALLFIFGRI